MRIQPPLVKLDNRGMVFNIPCVRLMPDVGYIQIFETKDNPKAFYLRPCKENAYQRIPWRANCGNRIYPRKYKDYGGYFYELCKRMNWFSDCSYTVEAEVIGDDDEFVLGFDLKTATAYNSNFDMKELFFRSDVANEDDLGHNMDVDSDFMEVSEMPETKGYQEISVDLLVPFKDHPFAQYEGQRFADMVESVRANGVLVPIVVRPSDDGSFEILSGHNRVAAAKEAGLETVPAVVREGLSDEEALFIVTETNLIQRSFADMKHSERAIAIAKHYDLMKKKPGYRSDLIGEIESMTHSPVANKSSMGKLGEQYGLSKDTIHRYLRVSTLIPALKERLDDGEFALRVAVTLSYLEKTAQTAVETQLAKGRKLTIKIANMLREEAEKGALPKDFIKRVFEPGFFPSKIKPVKFSGQFLSEFFDEGRSSEEIEATVAEALRAYLSK